MNRLLSLAWFHAGRIGPVGMVGIGLLMASGAYYAFLLPEQRQVLAQVKEESERLRRDYLRAAEAARAGRPDTRQALARFYARLQPIDQAGGLLQAIQAAAADHGLAAGAAEYKLVKDKNAGALAEYQVLLPLKGSYRQLRGFVGQVLAQVPGAALTDFHVRRETIASPELEARLRFTLYLRTHG